MRRPRPELLIVDRPGLFVVALVLGVVIALALVAIQRGRSSTWTSAPIAGFVLGAQAVLAAAIWVFPFSPMEFDKVRRHVLRYEIGWIIIVVAAIVLIGFWWRSCRGLPRRNIALFSVLMGVIATQALSAWIADIPPLAGVYLPVTIIVVTLTLFPLAMSKAVDAALVLLGTVCAVSLLTVPFEFDWAIGSRYRRIPAPFIDGRLEGVAGHANFLAPLAAFGLILSVTQRRGNARWFLAPMFALTLWLSDGRTQIIATLAILGGFVVVALLKRTPRVWVRRGVVIALAAIALVGMVQLSAGSGSADLQTLNGRTRLWDDAIEYWQSSPLYGVGPNAFDIFYRQQPGLGWANGAHNQLFQTLAGEGIIGVVVLVAAMMVFVAIASAADGQRKTQLVAVGVIGLTTMMTETPLWLDFYLPQWFVFLSVMVVLFAARPDDQRDDHAGSMRLSPPSSESV